MTNNAERELLPCPFCGGRAEIIEQEDSDGRFAAVGCWECGAGSRQHYFLGDDARDHVAGAWNKRAQALGVPDGVHGIPEIEAMIRCLTQRGQSYQQLDKVSVEAAAMLRAISRQSASVRPAVPTPPKSSSVLVERLEAFISQHGGDATHACDEYELLSSLKELIAEYKAETTSKGK